MYVTFYNRIQDSNSEDIKFPLVNIWSDSILRSDTIPSEIKIHSLEDEIGDYIDIMKDCCRIKLFDDNDLYYGYFNLRQVNRDGLRPNIIEIDWSSFNSNENIRYLSNDNIYILCHLDDAEYDYYDYNGSKENNYFKNLIDKLVEE